ncbi:MAG TPA: hypothetical protein VF783_23470, partial [Terriglobales bacterium]
AVISTEKTKRNAGTVENIFVSALLVEDIEPGKRRLVKHIEPWRRRSFHGNAHLGSSGQLNFS